MKLLATFEPGLGFAIYCNGELASVINHECGTPIIIDIMPKCCKILQDVLDAEKVWVDNKTEIKADSLHSPN